MVDLSWKIRHSVIWPQIHKHQLHFCLPAFYLFSINIRVLVVVYMPHALLVSKSSHAVSLVWKFQNHLLAL